MPLHDRHLIPGTVQGHVSERHRREYAPARGFQVQDSGFRAKGERRRREYAPARDLVFTAQISFALSTSDWRYSRVEDAKKFRGLEGRCDLICPR
jgi:hypothetical protein